MVRKDAFPNINPKEPDGIRPDGRPFRVMVVEDREFHRKQIVQILESEKYEVVAQAFNGKDALDKYNQNSEKIDFITTNLDMPKLDGYALLYQLKQKRPGMKIIFISDDTSKGVVQDLIKMGAADFILKPINRDTILSRIKLALKKT